MEELTLRKINKKYYQAGHYEKGRWINVKHLGTAEKIVRELRAAKKLKDQLLEHTKKSPSNPGKNNTKHTKKLPCTKG